MKKETGLIVALDTGSFEEARRLIEELSPVVDVFKVGLAAYTAFGEAVLEELHARGKEVFLDLKFHDIPNTVRQAVKVACAKKIAFLDVHALGGAEMIRKAREAIDESGRTERVRLLAVTVLTSMDESALNALGLRGTVGENVLRLARMAKEAGADGVVASPLEIEVIRKELGEDFLIVTPGVRPLWAEKADQRRVLTPREASELGADHIVVGRPIIRSDDPSGAAQRVLAELEEEKEPS